MIFVGYNPFDIDGGFIYRTENGQLKDSMKDISSTIGDLARVAVKFAHSSEDYEINFQSQFPNDTQEFTNAIDCYEMMTYSENKIIVKEVK